MSETVIYQYGLRPPCENADLVAAQLEAAYQYRKALCMIAREERAAIRAVIETHEAVQRATENAKTLAEISVDAARAMKQEHVRARKRQHSNELHEDLKAAREAEYHALNVLNTERARARKAEAEKVKAIQAEHHTRSLAAYEESPAFWGTKQLVNDAHDRSLRRVLSPGKSIALPLWDGLTTCDPHYPARADASMAVSVQVMGGVSIADAELGDDTRFRIEPAEWRPLNDKRQRPDPTSKRSQRRQLRTLAVRIGSSGREPVWARWHMVMHRPLPEGGVVQRVTARATREGPRTRWTAEFVVKLPTRERQPSDGKGVVSVNVGWRDMGDGSLRVAAYVDDAGTTSELRLPADILASLRKDDELRSIRDMHFNEARLGLAWWLYALGNSDTAPEWLREKTETLMAWRSIARLAGVTREWAHRRFDGDEEIYNLLEAWRYHDYHLWQWETSQRSQALARRRDWYRRFAAWLASQYRTLVHGMFDIRDVAQLPTESEIGYDLQDPRTNRVLACVSELREALNHAFIKHGGTRAGDEYALDVWDCKSVDITHECHVCGQIDEFDAAKNLHHTCSQCDTRWDQDENAARVQLARSKPDREWSGGDDPPGVAVQRKRPVESLGRFARAKRAKAERVAAAEIARNAAGNDAE